MGSHQSLNFDTFKCSGENLPNSSFPIFETFECLGQNSSKSFSLQMFHRSSVSSHITLLQIFSSWIFHFGQKDPIKVQILTLFSALVKIYEIPHIVFQTTSQLSSNFTSLFSVMKYNSSVLF